MLDQLRRIKRELERENRGPDWMDGINTREHRSRLISVRSNQRLRLQACYDLLEDAWYEDLKAWEGRPNTGFTFGGRTAEDLRKFFLSFGKELKLATFKGYLDRMSAWSHSPLRKIKRKDGKTYYSIRPLERHSQAKIKKEGKIWKHDQVGEEERLRGLLRRHNLPTGGQASMMIPIESLSEILRRAGM